MSIVRSIPQSVPFVTGVSAPDAAGRSELDPMSGEAMIGTLPTNALELCSRVGIN